MPIPAIPYGYNTKYYTLSAYLFFIPDAGTGGIFAHHELAILGFGWIENNSIFPL